MQKFYKGEFDSQDKLNQNFADLYQNVNTYSELKAMVTNKLLVAGTQYLLSDYKTKYRQPDTLAIKEMSSERIVLTASSENTFNVICSSLDFPQDIVYYDFNFDLCEDGVTPRNGYILRRISGNDSVLSFIDAPLDWRKILWARYKPNPTQYLVGTVMTNYSVWASGACQLGVIYKAGNSLYVARDAVTIPTSATDPAVFQKVYDDITIGMLRNINRRVGSNGTVNLYLVPGALHERPVFGANCRRISIHNAVLLGNSSVYYMSDNVFGDNCYSITLQDGCSGNTFGNDCYGISYGSDCRDNLISNLCNAIQFGSNCYANTFGTGCVAITFGAACINNTFAQGSYTQFGSYCVNNVFAGASYHNTFATNCCDNIFMGVTGGNYFANDCYANIFNDGCNSNTFGCGCFKVTLGARSNVNSFGSYCHDLIFGTDCTSNTFGSNCYNNTFGNLCGSNTLGSICCGNTFGNNCNYNNLYTSVSWNTFGANKGALFIKYMRSKNISAVTALESKDYTNTIEKRSDNVTVYWSLNNSNVPVYTTIA